MMMMMSLMMSKWPYLSRILEESLERATSGIMARTRASMNKEEDPTSLVLGARNLDISLRIVQKRKKRTKMTKKALPREED